MKLIRFFLLILIVIVCKYSGNVRGEDRQEDRKAGLNLIFQDTGQVLFCNPRVPSIGSKNLLPNASFEAGNDGWSSIGKPTAWGGGIYGLFGEIDGEVAREGKHSLRIELGPGKTEITYFDVWPIGREVQTAPLLVNRGWIDVVPGQKYTLSAYIRADRPGTPALMCVYRAPASTSQIKVGREDKNILLTKEWARYEFTITALEKQVFIAIGPDLEDKDDAAIIWIDAIQFEQGNVATNFSLRMPLEVGLSTGKFGNIFKTDEKISFKLTCFNSLDRKVVIPVQVNVVDYFDMNIFHTEKKIKVGANGYFDSTWPLLIPGTGYYKIKFSWKFENKVYSTSFPFALIDPYPWEDSPFGINHSPASDAVSRIIQQAGIKWDRNWSINWGLLEPERGKLSFSDADQQIANKQAIGFKTLALLPLPSTDWSSSAPDSVPAKSWNRMAYMPKDKNRLMDFIQKSIEHYYGKIKYWEFLNEPIYTSFCLPGKYYNLPGANYSPSDYTLLLKKAYKTIKSTDPSSAVIGGFSAEPWRYSKEFIQEGGLKYVDIFNIHNYGGFSPPESFIPSMDTLLSQMDQHGVRKPIWITEYAYYGSDSLPWTPWQAPANYWAANLLLKDERQCADWTIRYNTIMFARGVKKIFYHQGAIGETNNGINNLEFALLGEEGKPRKVYAAQAALSHILGPQFIYVDYLKNRVPDSNSLTHNIQGYSFQCNEKAVLIAWVSENEKADIILNVPQEVEIYNIMGTRIPNSSRIVLTHSPVYIVTRSTNAMDLVKSCNVLIDDSVKTLN